MIELKCIKGFLYNDETPVLKNEIFIINHISFPFFHLKKIKGWSNDNEIYTISKKSVPIYFEFHKQFNTKILDEVYNFKDLEVGEHIICVKTTSQFLTVGKKYQIVEKKYGYRNGLIFKIFRDNKSTQWIYSVTNLKMKRFKKDESK